MERALALVRQTEIGAISMKAMDIPALPQTETDRACWEQAKLLKAKEQFFKCWKARDVDGLFLYGNLLLAERPDA
jgi:hypothetical protein